MSIGQTLSAARQQAGLSVEDISAKTRLRATVVRAIEDDDFSLCGGDFYARGHIRTLALLVGADPVALLAEYDATIGAAEFGPNASQIFETEVGTRAITRQTERRTPHWGATAAGMALVAVIVVATVQLANGGGKKKTASSPPAAQVTASVPVSSPSPNVAASSPPTEVSVPPTSAPPSIAVAEAGVHVVLRVTTAKCWVSATSSNGKTLYQGLLNPGDSQTFDDPQKVSLRLGNAPATDLTVNGVDIGAPPSKTAVASVSFGPGNPTVAQG